MTDIDLDEFDPPTRSDFRRVGRGIPYVIGIGGERDRRVRYSRSSNSGKILDDESNLTDWKLRTVVAGAAQRPELMAMASVLDVDTDKKKLRDIAEECLVAGRGQRRSIIGTAVHSMFDHLDRNHDWTPPPQFAELCAAYQQVKEDWGLVPEEIEVHCINDEHRLAGTLDRRFRTTRTNVAPDGTIIPIGAYVVADHKTGKELEYASGSYATQIAAYVDSMRYDVETDERFPFEPESVKDWALIIHADSAGTRVEVYWVDIKAGRLGLTLAREVKAWRRRDDLLTLGRKIRIEPEPEAPPEPPTAPPERRNTLGRYEHTRDRVRAILAHSDVAAKALQRAWPMGTPGLREFQHSWEQLDQIIEAVERIEGDYSLPFFAPWVDPDQESPTINVWSKPSTSSSGNDQEKASIQDGIMAHPRADLIRRWIGDAVTGGIDHRFDTTALAHSLFEFAMLKEDEWNDDDLTLMLDGSLRAMGYVNGTKDLGRFNPEHAPILMSAAFAIAAGNAMLLFDEDENPIVRTNIKGV